MTKPTRPKNVHEAYHAHVYFDADSVLFAENLCQKIDQTFAFKVGRMHQKPVGPHTMWSCQVIFFKRDFDVFVPWLDRNRGELSVLVHGDTGEPLADHTTHAYWLGNAVELDLSGF